MINNPAWKRAFIRQTLSLAAGRIAAIVLAIAAVGTLCAAGIDHLSDSAADAPVVITIGGETAGN